MQAFAASVKRSTFNSHEIGRFFGQRKFLFARSIHDVSVFRSVPALRFDFTFNSELSTTNC